MALSEPILRGVRNVARSPLLHPLNDLDALDDVLAQINPLWSLTRVRARVVAVRPESPDVKTFVLRPNRNWRGHAPGQHVVIELELGGVRYRRPFSIASAPDGSGTIELTVKRQPRGRVTPRMHEQLKAGDVITLGPAAGDFVLPRHLPPRILMLSAGSGITPVMSMLRDLRRREYAGRIAFVHACRSPQDALFAGELHRLASEMPNLRYDLHCDSESGPFDAGRLSALAPDPARCHAFLCGPEPFMDLVRAHWQREAIPSPLQFERFGLPRATARQTGERAEVTALRSRRRFTAAGAQPLLLEAEAAGLNPKSGCRIGICQTCKCRKHSGTVENLLTGAVSSEPGELIQLCISAARSDVALDL